MVFWKKNQLLCSKIRLISWLNWGTHLSVELAGKPSDEDVYS